MSEINVPLPLLGSLLFSMMGPIALLPLFAQTTAAANTVLRRKIAVLAGLFAFGTLAVAVFVGTSVMASAGTSRSSLIIAAGLILFITALKNVFGGASKSEPSPPAPTTALAMMPLAIPGIVTPMGVAILILFSSYFPSFPERLAILGVVGGIMFANVGAMLGAHWFMRVIGPVPLIILGAIFGVLQAAMGIEMIMSGLKLSGFFLPR